MCGAGAVRELRQEYLADAPYTSSSSSDGDGDALQQSLRQPLTAGEGPEAQVASTARKRPVSLGCALTPTTLWCRGLLGAGAGRMWRGGGGGGTGRRTSSCKRAAFLARETGVA